jgi:phage/plasmid-like protein (TIGR03299 family)
MAHEFESGFLVKEAAWHKLGTVIQEAPTIEEGIRLAGLDWKVSMENLFLADGRITTQKAVIRETDKRILGYGGENWTPLQNTEAFAFFDEFLKTNEVQLETAGSLRHGQRIWVLARIKSAVGEVIKGDPIQRYFMLSNAHTRGVAVSVGFTDVRIVCKNTLAMAEQSTSSKLLRIHHSKNVAQNLEEIKSIINFSTQGFQADLQKMEALTRKGIVQKDIQKFVETIFFDPRTLDSKRSQNKLGFITDKINELIEVGLGAEISGVKGNAYGLYQATTEYLTHYDGKDYEQRLDKLWNGANKSKNEKALEYLLVA